MLKRTTKCLASALIFYVSVFPAVLFVPAVQVLAYTSPGDPTGFVNDYADLMSADVRADMEAKLVDFEKQTGNEIVVVTVTDLGDETIETYATKLFEEWGIGKADKDVGALLLVAPNDRSVRIEVGYGLEPYLTDAATSRIIRETIIPAFQAEDYSAGIVGGVDRMISGLTGQEDLSDDRMVANIMRQVGPGLLPLVLIFLFNLIPVIIYSKSWWLGGVLGFGLGFFVFSSFAIAGIVAVIGLIIDFILSKIFGGKGPKAGGPGGMGGVWFGGMGGGKGFGGGGFGGFGGGMSGGGGSSGRW